MRTKDAISVFGSVRSLADALEITIQAVYMWGDDVPKLRDYQIREKKPDRFNTDGSLITATCDSIETAS